MCALAAFTFAGGKIRRVFDEAGEHKRLNRICSHRCRRDVLRYLCDRDQGEKIGYVFLACSVIGALNMSVGRTEA